MTPELYKLYLRSFAAALQNVRLEIDPCFSIEAHLMITIGMLHGRAAALDPSGCPGVFSFEDMARQMTSGLDGPKQTIGAPEVPMRFDAPSPAC